MCSKRPLAIVQYITRNMHTVFALLCFAVVVLTDFPISIRLTSLALWQSNDCPSASKATLMNMDKYFMWIHYERLHNHNKAKHNKTVCIFLGIYCMLGQGPHKNQGFNVKMMSYYHSNPNYKAFCVIAIPRRTTLNLKHIRPLRVLAWNHCFRWRVRSYPLSDVRRRMSCPLREEAAYILHWQRTCHGIDVKQAMVHELPS